MQHQIINTTNLQLDATTAKQLQIPLMLVFSQTECPFCITLREEILQPMLISRDYDNRVLIREIMIDYTTDITDFSGEATTAREVFNRYHLFVTPSILLLNSQGEELAERQIGINTVDYYGYYLDQAIEQALTKLRH